MAAPHDGSHRRLTVAACLAMALFSASVVVPAISLNALGAEFGLSYADRGFLGAVRMAALVAALLCSGFLADRLGKRRFLVGGSLLLGAGMAATAGARGHAALLASQALVGLGCGAYEALANPLVAELNPKAAARALNLVNAVFSAGLVVAAVGTGELIQAGQGWRVGFWVWVPLAVVCAALFAAPSYPRSGGDPEAPDVPAAPRRALSGTLPFWILMAAMVCAGGCEAGMSFWGANFAEQELGATARGGAGTIAFFGGFMALGRIASGVLVARLSPLRLMLGSAAACALATAGLSFVQALTGAWTLFALGGLFIACFWPTLLAVGADRLGVRSSIDFGLLAAAGITGCMLLPWGIGVLSDAAGMRIGVALLPASMLLEALLLVALWRWSPKRSPFSAANERE